MHNLLKILPLLVAIGIMLFIARISYISLCEGDMGSHAFMSGDYNGIYNVCRVYDYSTYFPGFETQSDSLRAFR